MAKRTPQNNEDLLMTILRKPYHLLIIISAFLSTAHAQERGEIPDYRVFGEAQNKQEAEQIAHLVRDYRNGWKELNAEKLIALHTSDTEWTNAFARMFQDSKTLGTFLEKRLFPQFEQMLPKTQTLTIKPISLRYLGSDAAVIHLYTEFQTDSSRPESIRRTHFHLVAQQIDSVWKIAHTSIMDPRG